MLLPLVQIAPTAPESVHRLFARVAPWSVLVLTMASSTTAVVHYEGGIFERPLGQPPTDAQRRDYALRAGGRAIAHYPTIARLFIDNVRAEWFFQEGTLETETWTVEWWLTMRPLSALPDPLPPRQRSAPESEPPDTSSEG